MSAVFLVTGKDFFENLDSEAQARPIYDKLALTDPSARLVREDADGETQTVVSGPEFGALTH